MSRRTPRDSAFVRFVRAKLGTAAPARAWPSAEDLAALQASGIGLSSRTARRLNEDGLAAVSTRTRREFLKGLGLACFAWDDFGVGLFERTLEVVGGRGAGAVGETMRPVADFIDGLRQSKPKLVMLKEKPTWAQRVLLEEEMTEQDWDVFRRVLNPDEIEGLEDLGWWAIRLLACRTSTPKGAARPPSRELLGRCAELRDRFGKSKLSDPWLGHEAVAILGVDGLVPGSVKRWLSSSVKADVQGETIRKVVVGETGWYYQIQGVFLSSAAEYWGRLLPQLDDGRFDHLPLMRALLAIRLLEQGGNVRREYPEGSELRKLEQLFAEHECVLRDAITQSLGRLSAAYWVDRFEGKS